MLIRLDHASDTPLFEQLAQSIRVDIVRGRLKVGQRLLSAKQVSESVGVNVHTVLKAYQNLRDEGLVELHRGRGAVVSHKAEGLASLGDDLKGLSEKALAAGISLETLSSLIKHR